MLLSGDMGLALRPEGSPLEIGRAIGVAGGWHTGRLAVVLGAPQERTGWGSYPPGRPSSPTLLMESPCPTC